MPLCTRVDTLALKVTLTPLLIAAASVAQRRWGGAVGGLIAGLPLTSAPVSVFLAVEHGPPFAAHAAVATMLGVNAMSAFCVAYAKASARCSAWRSAALALLVCLAVTVIASYVPQQVGVAALITFPSLAALVVLIGRPSGTRSKHAAPPWWDVPARMVAATLVVVLVTGAAGWLGATWSGLLSTLPVYALVMGVFSHTHSGAPAAQSFLRGVTVGASGRLRSCSRSPVSPSGFPCSRPTRPPPWRASSWPGRATRSSPRGREALGSVPGVAGHESNRCYQGSLREYAMRRW